jgi:hypothetical protein
MNANVYTHTCTYMYTHMHTYLYAHTHMYTHMHTCLYAHTHTYPHLHTYTTYTLHTHSGKAFTCETKGSTDTQSIEFGDLLSEGGTFECLLVEGAYKYKKVCV